MGHFEGIKTPVDVGQSFWLCSINTYLGKILQSIVLNLEVINFDTNPAKYFCALTVSMSQNNANCKRAEVIREKNRHDEVSATAREEAGTEDTRTNLGSLPNWALHEHRRECAGMMDVKRFCSMAVNGRNHVKYERHCFEGNTALGAWKRCWVAQSRWCVDIFVDKRFADMSFV